MSSTVSTTTVETSALEHAQSLKNQEAALRETLATLEREEIKLREQLKQIDPAHWERTGRIEWQDMQHRFVENTLRLRPRNRISKKRAGTDVGNGDGEDVVGDGSGGGLETLSDTYGRNPLGVPKSLMEAAGTNRGAVEGAIMRTRRWAYGGETSEEGGGGGGVDDGAEGGGGGFEFVQAENAQMPDPDPQFFDFLAWVDAHATDLEHDNNFDAGYFALGGETQRDTQDSGSDEADDFDEEEEECIGELEQSLVRELQQLERMRFGFGQEVDFVDSEASPSEF
ncbi:hypothetical protein HDU81_001665 [Chytriomyces hyalinus]|nr:hypothetical protein HDU81_001665 [Chytriomyces hyalinus]